MVVFLFQWMGSVFVVFVLCFNVKIFVFSHQYSLRDCFFVFWFFVIGDESDGICVIRGGKCVCCVCNLFYLEDFWFSQRF